jgi:peptidoglycan biosynthesis protein MviN/MurJ (putative lipid II flippase)
VGLTAAASVAGWVELILLRGTLNRRIGGTSLPASLSTRLWSSAAIAAAVAWLIKLSAAGMHPIARGTLVLVPFAGTFFGMTLILGVEEARSLFARVRRGAG